MNTNEWATLNSTLGGIHDTLRDLSFWTGALVFVVLIASVIIAGAITVSAGILGEHLRHRP